MKRNFDYSKLRGRIVEKLGSIKKYAELLGLSDTSIGNKLKLKVPFTQDEILRSTEPDVLDIKVNDIPQYFFTKKVGENTTNNNETQD